VLLFGIYLVLIIALPVALSTIVGFRSLPRGAQCPNCAQDTLPILSQLIRFLKRARPATSLQRRWCPACSWAGYTRIKLMHSLNVTSDNRPPQPRH
jgi:hypothetical protein